MLLNCAVGEDSWESPGLQGDQPVHPEGDQSWVFIGRTDIEAETPILWPPDAKSWLIGKDPDAGKDWGWEEKWETEDKMVGWHHQLNGHEFDQTPGNSEGQGRLVCCSPWGRRDGHDWAAEQQWNSVHAILPSKANLKTWMFPHFQLWFTDSMRWKVVFIFVEGQLVT